MRTTSGTGRAEGRRALPNLVLLCRRHHRLVHEGGYAVDDRLRFYDPWGQQIESAGRPPPGDPDVLRNHIPASTIASGDGDPMDLAMAVEAFIDATAPQR